MTIAAPSEAVDTNCLMLFSEPPDSVLRVKLEDYGFRVRLAANNEDIDQVMNIHHCPLVIVDIEQVSHEDLKIWIAHTKTKNPEVKILGLFQKADGVKQREALSCGIDELFQIPFDEEMLINTVFEYAPIDMSKENITMDSLVLANVMELNNERPLPFDVYIVLPANRKVLKYRGKGVPIDQRVIEKSKKLPRFNVYILKSDIKFYHEFCADVIKKIYGEPQISKAEKSRRVKNEIRQLMRGFFAEEPLSEEDQSQMVNNIRKIVGHLDDESGGKKHLRLAVMNLAAEYMTNYSHSQNVATYCALFGQILGINEPESLIMGGAIHDIGMSDLPSHIIGKDLEELEEKEIAQYKLHPGNARYALMEKKMKLPEPVLKMVLQHHENTDGSGFPYGIKGEEIHPFAKICAFADRFDKLTSLRYGHKQLSPLEAVKKISGMNGKEPDSIYDPQFHKPLVDYFINLETMIDVEENMSEPEQVQVCVDSRDDQKLKAPVKKTRGYTMESAPIGREKSGTPPSENLEDEASAVMENFSADEFDFSSTETDLEQISQQTADMDLGELDSEISSDSTEMTLEEQNFDSGDEFDLANQRLKELADRPIDKNAKVDKAHGVDLQSKKDRSKKSDSQTDPTSQFNANARNKSGQTLIMHAAAQGKVSQIEQLIQLGADINAKDFKGHSPLMFASQAGQVDAAKILLRLGANIHQKDSRGRTPLVHAIEGGHRGLVKDLLVKGASLDLRIKGTTPLMLAAYLGDAGVVSALLDYGADYAAKDFKGHTALHYAMAHNHREAAALIVKAIKGI